MEKLDLRKLHKALYAAKAQPALVVVPRLQYLMVDGHGDPNDNPLFQDGMGALFSLAYSLKFALKKAGTADFGIMPPGGLWWSQDPEAFLSGDRGKWQWTLLLLMPELVSPEMVAATRAEVVAKKTVPRLEEVRLEALEEGLCAQVLHVGPYCEEGPTIARLHQFIADQGKQLHGKHHEIYLSDPRRASPEKLKTIIRQPVN